jgi:hypothetical protein
MASGVPEDQLPNADTSRDRMVARWRRERPNDPAPDLFLTYSIENMADRLAPTLALLARYPDDVLVMSAANMVLRSLNQTARTGELLEAFLQRNPDSSHAYRMLVGHYGRLQDETRKIELIARWAQREPVDPNAVTDWLSSSLAEQEPAATAALLDRFFARQPQGGAALSACSEIARRRPEYREVARACVARTAGGGDGSRAAKQAAEQASAELAAIAARDGDWQGLLGSLGKLPREQRLQALLSAVQQVPAPAGCATRVELLRVAAEQAPAEESERASLASSVAGALHLCAAHGPARAMYLGLLRTAPNPDGIVSTWTSHLIDPIRGDRWLGDLPAPGAAPILEQRLRESPGPTTPLGSPNRSSTSGSSCCSAMAWRRRRPRASVSSSGQPPSRTSSGGSRGARLRHRARRAARRGESAPILRRGRPPGQRQPRPAVEQRPRLAPGRRARAPRRRATAGARGRRRCRGRGTARAAPPARAAGSALRQPARRAARDAGRRAR